MKLESAVSLLEAGGCVLSTACRTSALLADFDLAHWDTAGTASVKTTLFCLLIFLPLLYKYQPPDLSAEGKILPAVVLFEVTAL